MPVKVLMRGELLVEDDHGNQLTVAPPTQVTIGRGADFPVGGDDPSMHRRFLHVWSSKGDWLIQNVGTFITATIHPEGVVNFVPQRLAPGDIAYVPVGVSSIGWATKNGDYMVSITNASTIKRPQLKPASDLRATTENFMPSAEQKELLAALAAPVRDNPLAQLHTVVPTVEELAEELGWTKKKTEQKILRIVDALERAGVPEFQRSENRVPWRVLLARFAYEQGERIE